MTKWLFLVILACACGETSPTGAISAGGKAGFASDAEASDRSEPPDALPRADALSTDDPPGSTQPDGAPGRDAGPTLPLTIEALQVIGTHNSYHIAPAIAFDASHKYTQLPLDQQLAGGVRALELDLHLRSDGVFEIYHISIIDPNTTCSTLDDCLHIVATWSDAHPNHTPIFLWFELKDDTGGQPINDIVPVETAILKVFAREQVITPAWLRGSYASPRERIVAAGWPTLEEARGKIMFAIITRDARTQQYAHDFTSLDDRLMFVNATPDQFTLSWASITKVDDVSQADIVTQAHAAHLLIATNVCAINMTDADCQTRLMTGVSGGIHMLHDDLPFPISGRTYSAKLPGGSPGCNPVTAPPACAPGLLE
jgi:calcium-dependent phosphoinositide phospholipase C